MAWSRAQVPLCFLQGCLFFAAVSSVYLLLAYSQSRWYDEDRSRTKSQPSTGAISPLAEPGRSQEIIFDAILKPKFLIEKFTLATADEEQTGNSSKECLHLALIYTKADELVGLDDKLTRSLLSILRFSDQNLKLCVHLITDYPSHRRAKNVINRIDKSAIKAALSKTVFYFHHVQVITKPIDALLPTLELHFSYKPGSYYSGSVFFTSLILHRVFRDIDQSILLDVDVQLNGNLTDLNDYFDHFQPNALIGIAFEQQPVYRHLLHEYRR